MCKMKKVSFIFLFGIFIFAGMQAVFAVDCSNISNADDESVCITNPLTGTSESSDPNTLIGRVINVALGLVGSLALVMFIYGGLTWMLSGGSSDKTSKGKNIIIWAALGMIMIFSAYAIVNFALRDVLGLG